MHDGDREAAPFSCLIKVPSERCREILSGLYDESIFAAVDYATAAQTPRTNFPPSANCDVSSPSMQSSIRRKRHAGDG
jgi:hypothetical protein